jgi:hypothetical protein
VSEAVWDELERVSRDGEQFAVKCGIGRD